MAISFSTPNAFWALLILAPLLTLPLLRRRLPAGGAPSSFVLRLFSDRTRPFLSILLRLLVGLGLILSLAGAQWVQPVDDVSVVFVLDLSASVPAAERERAEDFIRQAVAAMPDGARVAIVAFGEDALVERLASEERNLPPIASLPGSARTDIGAAIRLALALFPEESHKRLVLLSDGLENVGDARAQADLATARGVEIAVVALLAPPAEQEVYLVDLEVPPAVRQGQSFVIAVTVESTLAQDVTLRLLGDGRLLVSQRTALETGSNRVQFSLTADEAGFHRYTVELEPLLDTLPQNNHAAGFTVVAGPPRVLIAEGQAGEADALRRALESTGVEAVLADPAALPSDLSTLSSYDAVVLVDVPADALADGVMEALPVYVRELGRGLLMVGGEQSFGAGGYLRTPLEEALPVDMDVRSRTREPNLALVLVVDRSGSMGRCHCDNPNARPGEYARVEVGLPKVDIAKDAILMASTALGPFDYLGVVAFNENAQWAVELQPLVDASTLQGAIGGIQADGGTNIYAGLAAAEEALLGVEARVKHIVLLTDGWSMSGEYEALTARLADEGITLSIVAAGGGSAEYLEALAETGGGRYYPVPTIQDMPQIFFRETIEASGSYIVEESFYPLPAGTSEILRGLDPAALPALYGYNGTTPKATAQVSLVSLRGDPLLAQWQYGLGRAVAWTADLTGRWAVDWVEWQRFNTFAAQLVSWTLPEPADENLQVVTRLDGATVHLQVDAMDDQGRPRDLLETTVTLVGPALTQQSVELEQTAAGRYEGSLLLGEPGTYLVQVVQRDAAGEPLAQRTSGLVVPYSPEYRRSGSGGTLLAELAQVTGGQVIESTAAVFAPTAHPAQRTVPLWPSLLLLAALLFPFDVAARRLRLTASDWRRLEAWLRGRLPRRRVEEGFREPALLGELFTARERARRRARVVGEGAVHESDTNPRIANHESASSDTNPRIANHESASDESPITVPGLPGSRAGEGDTLARLRQARDRTRRDRPRIGHE